jgi:hypothetical protein
MQKALNCYDGRDTGLDTLIHINGYYTTKIPDESGASSVDMNDEKIEGNSLPNFMFFEDGIFVGDIGSQEMSVEQYLEELATTGKSLDFKSFYHGTYKIYNDTIKVQYISPGYANTWFAKEIWYKIIDKNTIVDFHSEHIALTWEDRKKDSYKPQNYRSWNYSRFVPLEWVPRSDSWLKKEKWFQCR